MGGMAVHGILHSGTTEVIRESEQHEHVRESEQPEALLSSVSMLRCAEASITRTEVTSHPVG